MAISQVELNRIVRELRKIEEQQRALESRKQELQDLVKAEMISRDSYELNGKDFHITWNTVCQTRFDAKAFALVQPELYAQYLRHSQNRRFCLS